MEINSKKEIKTYLPSLSKRFQVMAILFSTFLAVFVAAVIYLTSSSNPNWIILSSAAFLSFVFGMFMLNFTYHLLVEGLKEIMATLSHIAGENTIEHPALPKDPKYAGSGLGTAIDTIYELEIASKKTSEAKNDSNDSLIKEALNNTPTGIVIMKADQIVYANSATPVTIDRSGNKQLKLVFNGDDTLDNWVEACRENTVTGEKMWTRVPDNLPEDENLRYFDLIASFHRDSEYEVIITIIDRTDVYATSEEALNFIAFAAHELRGPITVIKGYLDVFEDELSPSLSEDHKELLRRLKVSASRLSGYINNILNTSRYDRRHLKLRLSEENISEVYDVIKEDMDLRASSQNRILNVSIPNNLPTIAADRNSLSEVFTNLIDNAIKYSNEGGVISVSARANDNSVQFIVQDQGIGMPANVVANLFQKFYRSHRSRENVTGTGIGLYISKAIVESHGGEISVSSIENQGSVFSVTLPTYTVMSQRIKDERNSNESIINKDVKQITNHAMYKG